MLHASWLGWLPTLSHAARARRNGACWAVVVSAAGLLASGCSASGDANANRQGGVTVLPATSAANAGHGATSAPGSFGNASPEAGTSPAPKMTTASGGVDASAACAAESQMAKAIPVDVYIMMDQSASMILPAGSGTRWSAITDAMQMFVNRPEAAGVGVGIQYFGLGVSCDAADYASPDVEIAPLPDNAKPIADSITSHLPIATTPTEPALQGAIDHAQQWQGTHPDHVVVVVLATDGEPDSCASTTDSVAMVAAMGLSGAPSIRTFVIGVGSGLDALNQVAQSGGTDKSFIVDDGQDPAQQFLDALNNIRQKATLPCDYALPTATGSTAVDFDKVNVNLTPSLGPQAGHEIAVLRAPDATRCDPTTGGWYYDDPQTPKSLKLCDQTCTAVTQDDHAKLDILLGCQSRIVMLH
jgi:hypothetical protein